MLIRPDVEAAIHMTLKKVDNNYEYLIFRNKGVIDREILNRIRKISNVLYYICILLGKYLVFLGRWKQEDLFLKYYCLFFCIVQTLGLSKKT